MSITNPTHLRSVPNAAGVAAIAANLRHDREVAIELAEVNLRAALSIALDEKVNVTEIIADELTKQMNWRSR